MAVSYREKRYDWSFEVAGPYAMFTRPDTGSSPISYPAPTRSAIMGMASCLAFSKDAFFWPERVEICAPVIYHSYVQNYRGPLRKPGTTNFQIMMTVLEDVVYKIYGTVHGYAPPNRGKNPMHELQEVLKRRLKAGLFYRTPALGLKEFVPVYFGPVRASTCVDDSINTTIPSMLDVMYDRQTLGHLAPKFSQELEIRQGVLHYAQ